MVYHFKVMKWRFCSPSSSLSMFIVQLTSCSKVSCLVRCISKVINKNEMNLNVISMYFWAIARIHRIAFYLRGTFPTTSDKYVIWYLINWCVTCDLESVFCCPSLLLDLIYWQESNWRRCQTKDLVLLYIFKIHGCEMEKIALVHYMDNTLKKIKD